MEKILQNRKEVFAFFLALCLGMGTAYAYDFSKVCSTGQRLYYNIIDATNHYVALTYPGTSTSNPWGGYTQPEGNITLPSSVTYNGFIYTVKAIGTYAFYQCLDLTGPLTIPNSVLTIGNYAFYDCNYFTGLTIGSSVTSIGENAFAGCSGFTQVNYNVTNCANIASDDTPFMGCGGTLTIGSNVARIPSYMFDESSFSQVNYNATNCADASLPSPFSYCSGPLIIGNDVTRIPSYMFYDCVHFSSLTIGSSVTTIGTSAFRYCSYGNDGLSGNLTIPNSVTTIGAYAFEDCRNFADGTLTVGTNVTSIGAKAFRLCNFSKVKYNATNCADVTENDKPFETCGGSLTIGTNVQRIPAYMFYYCSGFTGSLTIPNSVTKIGDCAFEHCSGFTGSLNIGTSVTTIDYSAFCGCTGFTSLYLGSSVNTIGIYAFYGCSGLTGSLSIPNSVTTLNTYAFAECSGLTDLTIGSSVSTLSYGAFDGCRNLASMTVLPETPPGLDSYVFRNVPKTIPVYVPCSSLEDYQAASDWNEFTNMQCKPEVTVTVVPTEGGMVSGGGTYTSGSFCTVTATPNSDYLFMHWSQDGTVVSSIASYTFTVTQDVELEAVFMSAAYAGPIIGEGKAANAYLPSYSLYNYTLSQQIYTASEIGGSTTITSISFFNAGTTKTRSYDIYMKHTTKSAFSDATDWISASSSYKVYSGFVTMRAGQWTTIELDTPFAYNGTANLVLIVDDNTGSWSGGMSCRVYDAQGNQALRIYSDGTNYNPASPSSYSGTPMNVKNQIMFNRQAYNIVATTANTTAGTVSGSGQYGLGDWCTLKATANMGYTFIDWMDDSGVVVSTDANYSFTVKEGRSLTANFVSDGNFCSLTFDLYDSHGDGWNGNYLVVDFGGISKKLAVPYGEKSATYTLPVEYSSEVELSWIQGSFTPECSFAVSDPYRIKYVGSNLNGNFEYSFLADCGGDSELTYVGIHGGANNYYLPSYSFYNYTLSEQIYTADEIGTSGLINSIAFYNKGTRPKTRYYSIYLAITDKTEFESQTDWINASDAVLVFNDSVTMHSGRWTPIFFSTPFDYDGISNLVLIVDDNTGDYTGSPHMSCLVYPADGLQTLRLYSDGTNYDPYNPSSYMGTFMNVKNQVMFNIVPCVEPTTVTQTIALSAGFNWISTEVEVTLDDLKVALVAALPGTQITIYSQSDGNTTYNGSTWRGQLTTMNVSQMYMVNVTASCEITLTGAPVNPTEHPVTMHSGFNWIAFPLSQSMTLTNAFAGFAINGDMVISQGNGSSTYIGGRWRGTLTTFESGKGYIYKSAATGNRTFTFPIDCVDLGLPSGIL